MFLSNASIKRPVAMCCLIIALAFLGANAYRKLSLELLPKMDVPYVTVVTTYPGASPNDIEVDVAKKIEDAVTLHRRIETRYIQLYGKRGSDPYGIQCRGRRQRCGHGCSRGR